MARELTTDEIQAIVDQYRKGVKLLDIEREFGITRAHVYYVLDRQGVAPNRLKSRTLDEQEQLIKRLFEIIESQEAEIARLKALLD
jgi:hypothetical protein